MTPLESLTAKIHALLPELMELSFGCRVKYGHAYGLAVNQSKTGLYVLFDGFTSPALIPRTRFFEALGHPIHLQHIFCALEKDWVYHIYSYGERRAMDEDGEFYNDPDDDGGVPKNYIAIEVDGRSFLYNLTLPFDKQTPELHQFLDDLLPSPNEE